LCARAREGLQRHDVFVAEQIAQHFREEPKDAYRVL
jgi:hypothetical protein